MTDIVAYLTANGVTRHDANNAVQWAHTVAWEMTNRVKESGGYTNPSMSAHYRPMREDLLVQCTCESLNCMQEWYEREAREHGMPVKEIPPVIMSLGFRMEVDIFQ